MREATTTARTEVSDASDIERHLTRTPGRDDGNGPRTNVVANLGSRRFSGAYLQEVGQQLRAIRVALGDDRLRDRQL